MTDSKEDGSFAKEKEPSEDEERRSVGAEIELAATREVVWKALSDARELERWFPLEARVEPGEGGSIFMGWKNEYQGEAKILAWDPPFHLRLHWVEGAEVTDYHVESRGEGRTLLRVVSSFPLDGVWEDDWIEGTERGWGYVLACLGRYLERHAGEDRAVLFLRRKVVLPREEVWARLADADGGVRADLLRGRTVDGSTTLQRVLVTERPAGGLLRVSAEPSYGAPGCAEATVFLSAWGDAAESCRAMEGEWRAELRRILPEGEDV
jgi:uncharacterized protein YndB with AHSA1/START domain